MLYRAKSHNARTGRKLGNSPPAWQGAWLLFSYFPFPILNPAKPPCMYYIIAFSLRRCLSTSNRTQSRTRVRCSPSLRTLLADVSRPTAQSEFLRNSGRARGEAAPQCEAQVGCRPTQQTLVWGNPQIGANMRYEYPAACSYVFFKSKKSRRAFGSFRNPYLSLFTFEIRSFRYSYSIV